MDMENKEVRIKQFVQAVGCLPPRLQNTALHLSESRQELCEELRLRAGQPPHSQIGGEEEELAPLPVQAEELREIVSRAARYSVHSYGEALAQGYLPLEGGHRLGICGTAIVKDGQMAGIRTISSLNLRIARQHFGVSDAILPRIRKDGRVRSALILSPPGFGKTTLLRDLIRQLSRSGVRVAVADERGELAAMREGTAQFDVGPLTDILDGCPKSQGTIILLKTMSPAVVALDEITSPADVEAIAYAGHCGVSILATAHAMDWEDLKKRPLYRELLRLSVFDIAVCITKTEHIRKYQIEEIGGMENA